MVEETSAEAFHEADKKGVIKRVQRQVYLTVCNYGPITAQEVWHRLRDEQARKGKAHINGITPRFAELRRCGSIARAGKRKCSITGSTCFTWVRAGELPDKVPTSSESQPIWKRLGRNVAESIRIVCESQVDKGQRANLDFRFKLDVKRSKRGGFSFQHEKDDKVLSMTFRNLTKNPRNGMP